MPEAKSKRSDPSATVGKTRSRLPDEIGAILEFVEGEEKGRKVPLLYYRTVLGRKYGDVLIHDLKVSSTHASIEFRGGAFRVIDLGSSNGTFVGKEQIRECLLEEGDIVRIGNAAFTLRFDPQEAAHLAVDRPTESVMEAEQEGMTQLITREFLEAVDDVAAVAAPASKVPEKRNIALQVVSGPDRGKTFVFDKSKVVIGRVQADAKLRDGDVSRKHAVLEVQEDGDVLLRDLASTNGTFVNGKPISNCALSEGDQIKIGGTEIVFSLRRAT